MGDSTKHEEAVTTAAVNENHPGEHKTSFADGESISELESQKSQSRSLKRSLRSRHISMISLGGVIGQGLFLSAGGNLYKGGPAGALIAYAVIGFIVFWVAYSLGEMATYIPVSGSFTIYCRRFVDESFGAMIGYNYWACWAVIVAAELVALPLVLDFWTQAVPSWAWSLIWLVIIFTINMFGARGYGESEYWFSMIKVLTIIIFIIVGCFVSGGVIGDEVYGFKYWRDPGAFSHGVLGVINSFVLASLSMQGTEIVGITAGECDNPKKQVPRAIRNVFWRVLLFYLGSVFVMGMVIPWNDERNLQTSTGSVAISPFTLVFEKGSLSSVAHIMNAVILITVLSCANSGLYVSSRTLYALANEGIAWKRLAWTTKRGVPVYAVFCTCLISLVTLATSFIPGKALFSVLTSLSGVAGFVTWGGISAAHFRFRQAFKKQGRDIKSLPFLAPLHPFGDIFNIFACTVIALISGYSYFSPANAVGLVGNYAGLILCAIGFTATKLWTKSKLIPLDQIDLDTGRADYTYEDYVDKDKLEESTLPLWKKIWKKLLHIFT